MVGVVANKRSVPRSSRTSRKRATATLLTGILVVVGAWARFGESAPLAQGDQTTTPAKDSPTLSAKNKKPANKAGPARKTKKAAAQKISGLTTSLPTPTPSRGRCPIGPADRSHRRPLARRSSISSLAST